MKKNKRATAPQTIDEVTDKMDNLGIETKSFRERL